MNRTNLLRIRTPEGVAFSQLLAGPMARFLAWLIDLALVVAVMNIIGIAFSIFGLINPGLAAAVSTLVSFFVFIGYGIGMEWHFRGQTYGKRLLRLRVVDAHGLRLQFSQVVIRNLLRAVDMQPLLLLPGMMIPAPYLLGGLSCYVNRLGQRVGDYAANTVVIREPKLEEPNLDQLLAGKYNSFRNYPHLEARLRQRVSAAEASLALRALVRRQLFEPQARVELFQQIADHLRSKVAFPDAAIEGISDEQYLRNAVDVLFRSHRSDRSAPTPAVAG